MNQKFNYQSDPQNKSNFKFLIVAVFLTIAGVFLIFISNQNLAANNPNIGYIDPKYGWLFLCIGLFLIFVYAIFPKSIKSWLSKLDIIGTDLIIKNPADPIIKISILNIDSLAMRYEVGSIRISGPEIVPFLNPIKNYRFYVRQWGYLIKTKDGQLYEIKQSIEDFEAFLRELQNINSAISQNQELESQSKQRAEEDFKKTRSYTLSQKIIYEKDL